MPRWQADDRATADNQSAQAEEEGLEPTKEWVKELIKGRVKLGALTLNEMRGALGLDPFDNAAADRPMVLTPTGYVPIEAGASPPSSSAGGAPRGASAAGTPLTRGRTQRDVIAARWIERGNNPELEKYSPDQPRVPAGNPDGGQWAVEDDSGSGSDVEIRARATTSHSFSAVPGQASLETEARSDATNAPPGVQYAAGPSRYSIDTSALTGISQIDDTTRKLLEILVDTRDRVGFLSGTPQLYGMVIHEAFAVAVIIEGIQGISASDVERSFPLPAGYPSAKKSVRPDVILRGDGGDILAIYDVKTGDPVWTRGEKMNFAPLRVRTPRSRS